MKLFRICLSLFSFLFVYVLSNTIVVFQSKAEQNLVEDIKTLQVDNKQQPKQQQMTKQNIQKNNSNNSKDKVIKEDEIDKNNIIQSAKEQVKNKKNSSNINVNNEENNKTLNAIKNSIKSEIKNNSVKNNDIKYNNIKVEDNLFHIVKPGDNIYRISLIYGINQKDLMAINNMENSNVRIGQKLLLPKGVIKKDINIGDKGNDNNGNEKNDINNNLNKVENTKNVISENNFVSKINSTTFIWPVRGSILSHFGHITNGGKLEGVNIGCEKGTNVRASASGEVVFNNNVDGYGNVILIKHYNGFFTAYGYIDPLVVEKDKIKKGQVIAYVKNKAGSNRAILYFSIRKGHKSYDPEKIIPVKISS